MNRPRLNTDTRSEPEPPAPGPTPDEPQVSTIRVGRGDRLVVERDHPNRYDFVGGAYYLISKELSAKLPTLGLTATQYDLLHLMMGVQQRGGVVRQTQTDLGHTLGIDRKEVGKAMQPLVEIGLIWQEKRGLYRINPRCAFYGRSGEQAQAVEEIPAHVPELRLPETATRPPRRKRRLKGVPTHER